MRGFGMPISGIIACYRRKNHVSNIITIGDSFNFDYVGTSQEGPHRRPPTHGLQCSKGWGCRHRASSVNGKACLCAPSR